MKNFCLLFAFIFAIATPARTTNVRLKVNAGRPLPGHALSVTPPPATPLRRIDINCYRKKAAVYVNGTYMGRPGAYDDRPHKLKSAAGHYHLCLAHGKKVHMRKVRVRAGKEINLKLCFQAAPRRA